MRGLGVEFPGFLFFFGPPASLTSIAYKLFNGWSPTQFYSCVSHNDLCLFYPLLARPSPRKVSGTKFGAQSLLFNECIGTYIVWKSDRFIGANSGGIE